MGVVPMSCCNTSTVSSDECASIHFNVNKTVVNEFKIYDQVYACVCVGICVDGCVCLCVGICVDGCVCLCVGMCVDGYVCLCVGMCVWTCVCVFACEYVHVWPHSNAFPASYPVPAVKN